MAANEKTSTATRSLWRINYQYTAKNFQLRGGAIVLEASSIEEANKKAFENLATSGLQNYRITSTKPY